MFPIDRNKTFDDKIKPPVYRFCGLYNKVVILPST